MEKPTVKENFIKKKKKKPTTIIKFSLAQEEERSNEQFCGKKNTNLQKPTIRSQIIQIFFSDLRHLHHLLAPRQTAVRNISHGKH
jgi:hypothetical protein